MRLEAIIIPVCTFINDLYDFHVRMPEDEPYLIKMLNKSNFRVVLVGQIFWVVPPLPWPRSVT